MPSDEANGARAKTTPDSLRIAAWAVGSLLGSIGLFFGLYSGQPWPSKDIVTQLGRDVVRLDLINKVTDGEARSHALAIQALRYELERLKEREAWLETEVERLKDYVYPQPSGRSRRPPSTP